MDKYFKLDNNVSFFVPSTQEGSKKITKKAHTQRMQEIARIFSNWFGGANVQNVTGFYTMESGQLVKEVNYLVKSACTKESLQAHRVELIKLAHTKCKEWTQETIGIEINSTFYLID